MSKTYKVTEVTTKTYANGTKTMWEVTLDGETGVHKKMGLFNSVAVGDTVTGEVYTNDKGFPAFKQEKQGGYKPSYSSKPSFGGFKKAENPNKDISIVWQSSLKSAIELMKHPSLATVGKDKLIDTVALITSRLVAKHDEYVAAHAKTDSPAPAPVVVEEPVPEQPGMTVDEQFDSL